MVRRLAKQSVDMDRTKLKLKRSGIPDCRCGSYLSRTTTHSPHCIVGIIASLVVETLSQDHVGEVMICSTLQ